QCQALLTTFCPNPVLCFFCFNATPTTLIYTFPYTTLFRSNRRPPKNTAKPKCTNGDEVFQPFPPFWIRRICATPDTTDGTPTCRSEEHTSELQSRENLVSRLLLEKKKNTHNNEHTAHRQSK